MKNFDDSGLSGLTVIFVIVPGTILALILFLVAIALPIALIIGGVTALSAPSSVAMDMSSGLHLAAVFIIGQAFALTLLPSSVIFLLDAEKRAGEDESKKRIRSIVKTATILTAVLTLVLLAIIVMGCESPNLLTCIASITLGVICTITFAATFITELIN